MHLYKAFGLAISSEIPLDELIECHAAQTDVVIEKGRVPSTIPNAVLDNPQKKIGADSFLLKVPNIASYFVEKGSRIVVEPEENALPEGIKTFLLGSCMGALLYQRKILPLHGSCVSADGRGILITGNSGAGKSTISSAMYKKGYKMITDDVAAVFADESNAPLVHPSFPGQKLWEDAIDRIGRSEEKKPLNRILNDMNKYAIKSHAYFCDEPQPIKFIFEIIPASVGKVTIDEINGTEKLDLIMKNAYRKRFPHFMRIEDWFFSQCVSVAKSISAFRIKRPNGVHLENEIADLIMETVK